MATTAKRTRRSTLTRDWATLAIAFLSFLASISSALLLVSYSPASPLCGPGCLEHRLDDLASAPEQSQPGRVAEALDLVDRELRYSPVDIAAWLRRAALQASVAGRLDAAAQADVMASYRFAPVDAQVARWRLAFLFEHWDQLNPQLREAAEVEVKDLMVSPANIELLKQIGPTVHNPAGRLASELLVTSFSRSGAP